MMKLHLILCLLSPWFYFGPTSAQENGLGVETVEENADALLRCSLESKQKVEKFDWRKDNGEYAKKEVFFYDRGNHYNNNLKGQGEQFKGRVSFFKEELEAGNASIKIEKTRLDDNGIYICVIFEPYRKEIQIRLNVDGVLKRRINVPGAAPEPHVKSIPEKNKRRLLECKVEGVPKPDVEWRNSAGEVLAKLTNVTENNERFLKLYVNVTKSDTYTCVATQRSIFHQINNTLEVEFPEQPSGSVNLPIWVIVLVMVIVLALFVLVIVLCFCKHCKSCNNKTKVKRESPRVTIDASSSERGSLAVKHQD